MIQVKISSNGLQVSTALTDAGWQVLGRARQVTRHHGLLLQTRVKAHASKPRTGPPGPRIITGDYNRSISLQMSGNANVSIATVGTNKPQGRRLEFGFIGTDSLGRHYNQPPYPHFRPALDQTRPGYEAAIAALVADIR